MVLRETLQPRAEREERLGAIERLIVIDLFELTYHKLHQFAFSYSYLHLFTRLLTGSLNLITVTPTCKRTPWGIPTVSPVRADRHIVL